MNMNPACQPPVQPSITAQEQSHPRYGDYLRYRSAMSQQMVTGATFARWLEMTLQDEEGSISIYQVTSPAAQLKPGWYRDVYGPRRVLKASFGPFTTEQEAQGAEVSKNDQQDRRI